MLGLFAAGWLNATLINLTQVEVEGIAASSSYQAGAGQFLLSSGASGSGTLTRWYGVQGSGTEAGYNYDGNQRNLPFDQKTGGVMEPMLQLGMLDYVMIDGNEYAEFILDINQNNGLLSLDSFKLFVNANPLATPYVTNKANLGQLGSLVYDLDAVTDHSILLQEVGSGSGFSDLSVFVSRDVFSGFADDAKVYLFSEFGGAGVLPQTNNGVPTGTNLNFAPSAGFEEWGYRRGSGVATAVPEPSTVVGGVLLALVIGYRARRFVWKRT